MDTNIIRDNLLLVRLLLSSFVDSPQKEHRYDTSFFRGVSELLSSVVEKFEHNALENGKSLLWLKFVTAGLYYYNESASVEFSSDCSIRFYIYILDNIIQGTVENILPLDS